MTEVNLYKIGLEITSTGPLASIMPVVYWAALGRKSLGKHGKRRQLA